MKYTCYTIIHDHATWTHLTSIELQNVNSGWLTTGVLYLEHSYFVTHIMHITDMVLTMVWYRLMDGLNKILKEIYKIQVIAQC